MAPYGQFHDICAAVGSSYATMPVCYLFLESPARGGSGYGGCELEGINVGGGDRLANLGRKARETRKERALKLTVLQGQ